MYYTELLLFSTIWCFAIYAFNSLLARQWIQLKPRQMLTYIFTMMSLGLFGEVVYGLLYNHFLGMPLWQYHLLPIHDAYTSIYSMYLWGMVGFHLYLLHGTLEARGISNTHKLAAIFCIEAIILEALVNITYMAIFDDYIYYYLPGDLWHITSLQTLPLYLLAGYITAVSLKLAKKTPRYAFVGNLSVVFFIVVVR